MKRVLFLHKESVYVDWFNKISPLASYALVAFFLLAFSSAWFCSIYQPLVARAEYRKSLLQQSATITAESLERQLGLLKRKLSAHKKQLKKFEHANALEVIMPILNELQVKLISYTPHYENSEVDGAVQHNVLLQGSYEALYAFISTIEGLPGAITCNACLLKQHDAGYELNISFTEY